jgi:purine-binding chemotaxis protein CheW
MSILHTLPAAASRATTTATAPEPPTRGGKFLTFYLADEEYGVEILKVQEIIGLQPITRVPRTPAFIRGVINLRGKVIPIMDLRERFGMPSAERALAGASAADVAAAEAIRCIIVVQVVGPTGAAVPVGIVVDRVSEVSAIAEAEIEDAPSFGAGVRTEYLLGLGKAQGRVKLLLDIDRVLAAEEIAQLPDGKTEAAA